MLSSPRAHCKSVIYMSFTRMQAEGHPAMLPSSVVRECIASRLWTAKEKGSLLAMMRASREFRLIVSSFIDAVEVEDAASMQPFPRHATIHTLGLWMKLTDAPDWLRTYAASDPDAAGRLQLLEKFKFNLNEVLVTGSGFIDPDPEDGPALLETVSQLCPNVRRLMVYLNQTNAINLPFLRSLGRHMPHLTELCLDRGEDGQFIEDDRGSMDWAVCLPPCLAKLSMPNSCLSRELIRELVRLPLLLEVEAGSLEEVQTWMNEDPVKMEACAWQMLRYVLQSDRDGLGNGRNLNHALVETLRGGIDSDRGPYQDYRYNCISVILPGLSLHTCAPLTLLSHPSPPWCPPILRAPPPRLKTLPHWDTVWPPPRAKLGPVHYDGHDGSFHGPWFLEAPSSEQTEMAIKTAARLAKCMNADWKGALHSWLECVVA